MSVTGTIVPKKNPRESPPHHSARFDPAWLVVLSLPWIVLSLDTTWLFAYATSSYGFIDPWVYFGFFFDLVPHIRAFKGAYFTTRLTWTVPGAIVYHVFSPITATYVLHLTLFYASILSLYFILKATVSRPAALLATLLMAFHSYFLWSIGWPYIDGPANMYVLLTLAALTCAARSTNPKWWLAAAGTLAAKAIYCQFFLIVFSPLIFGYYYFARPQMGHQRATSQWKPFAGGFAFVTLAFGIFNMAINGRFLFFINSVGMAAKLVVNHNPYNDSTYGWLSSATWLVLPAVATMGALVCTIRRRSLLSIPNAELLLFWQRYLLLSIATMLFWQFVGQPVLQLSTYASYLLPAVFLALGSQIAIVAHCMRKRALALLYTAVLVIGIAPLLLSVESNAVLALRAHPILISFAVGALATLGIARQVRRAGALSILALAISIGTLNAATSTRTWTHGSLPHDERSQESALLAIADSVRTVQQLDPAGNLYFWYDGESRLGRLYRDAASTYLWSYRLQSENFPEVGAKTPPPKRRILILTENPEVALKEAQASLAKSGLAAQFITQRKIQRGLFAWNMIEIEITRTP
jgi:hypothetical protein